MSKGLTLEQMEFLLSKGLSGEDMVAFGKLPSPADLVSAGATRSRAYRARRNLSDADWASLTKQVTERDGWVCTYCDCDTSLEQNGYAIDHILAISRCGTNHIDNLTMACRSCNSSKQDKLVDDEWTPPNCDFARWNEGGVTQ